MRCFCIYNIHDVYLIFNTIVMRKNIDIDETTLKKLKLLAAFEDLSVKAMMEKAVRLFVNAKEKEHSKALSDEEKEDLGLLVLMQQANKQETASRDEIMDILDTP